MHPLIEVFGFEVGAYRLLTIAAVAVAALVTARVGARSGLDRRTMATFLVATLVGALLGARLFAAATAADRFDGGFERVVAPRFGDMAMFGGLAGAAVAGVLAAHWLKQRPERLADTAAPAIALGIVVLRTGCLLAGCCVGNETGVAWGITYPEGSWSHLNQRAGSVFHVLGPPHAVHPIPVYEMIAGGVLLVASIWSLRRPIVEGASFAIVVGGYALARLLIHPFRMVEQGSTPSWFDPVMYLVVALASALWLIHAGRHRATNLVVRDRLVLRSATGPAA